jgi:sugar phosphate isomerase/epimerase
MKPISRKKFVQTSALLLAALAGGSAFAAKGKEPRLSFSTLGCPDWTFEQIVRFAAQHGYKGLEIRGIQRQMDLPLVPEFSTIEARKKTLAMMKAKGLSFAGLGSSANLHHPAGAEREKNLQDAKSFIDLAQQLSCPYVRVFPNNFPKEGGKAQTIDLIVAGLQDLGHYAKGKGVTVLLETHGDVVYIDDLLQIMRATNHPQVALIWDVTNMWVVTKEPPAEAYKKLKPYIRHVHIKDATLVGRKPAYTLLGQGEIPVMEGINALASGGYSGYYSFEWEKLWHPEIAEPEVALAHYPVAMKAHFSRL